MPSMTNTGAEPEGEHPAALPLFFSCAPAADAEGLLGPRDRGQPVLEATPTIFLPVLIDIQGCDLPGRGDGWSPVPWGQNPVARDWGPDGGERGRRSSGPGMPFVTSRTPLAGPRGRADGPWPKTDGAAAGGAGGLRHHGDKVNTCRPGRGHVVPAEAARRPHAR